MGGGRSRPHEYHVGAIAWQCRDALRDRVIGNRPFVQFDTQAGLFRHLDRSVRDLQRPGEQVLYQWVAGPVQRNSNPPGIAATKCNVRGDSAREACVLSSATAMVGTIILISRTA